MIFSGSSAWSGFAPGFTFLTTLLMPKMRNGTTKIPATRRTTRAITQCRRIAPVMSLKPFLSLLSIASPFERGEGPDRRWTPSTPRGHLIDELLPASPLERGQVVGVGLE